MSHRTAELPPRTGIAHLFRELRYHEASRQVFAVVLIVIFTLTARTVPLAVWIGAPIALLGTAVRLYASGFILKNEVLATIGPYRFVRHPLYTGNILLVTGFAIAGARWWGVPIAVFFYWFYYPTAIEYEDRKLRRIFGDAWVSWAARTPALVPGWNGSKVARGALATVAAAARDAGASADGASRGAASSAVVAPPVGRPAVGSPPVGSPAVGSPAVVSPPFGSPAAAAPPNQAMARWSLATSNRRNGELVLVIFELVCMAWLVWRAVTIT